MAPNKLDCSAITSQLYRSALRLINGDAEVSKELVQQVWEKVLAKGIYNSSKCTAPFLLEVLKNHYSSISIETAKINYNVQLALGDFISGTCNAQVSFKREPLELR
jgi:hypothetical protein